MTVHKLWGSDMSKEKLARRKAMGDDPTAVSKSSTTEAGSIQNYGRPMPGNDQRNNVDLNPMNSQSMGGGAPTSGSMSGQNMYPYNDGGISSSGGPMGANGFVAQQSQIPQNQTIGTGYNSKFRLGEVSSPVDENARMMEPFYLAEEAANRARKLYGEGEMPSYTVGPLGMMGTPVEVGRPNPGQFPSNMSEQSQGYLPLQGMSDVQGTSGLNTSTGGRNKSKGDK